jgi:type II secretory pathway pseudopilin PulG
MSRTTPRQPPAVHLAFTLMELIIAITILVLGLTSIFSLAVFTNRLNQENLRRVTALELAKEGIEAVRNMRDSNWKQNELFNGGETLWGERLDTAKTIIISPVANASAPWHIASVDPAQRSEYQVYRLPVAADGTALFTQASTSTTIATPFYRYVRLQPVDMDLNPVTTTSETLEVTATVLWEDNGQEKKVELINYLTDWRKL